MAFRSRTSALILTAMAAAAIPARAGNLGSAPINMRVGALAVVTPKYEGASVYEVTGVPFLGPTGGTMDGRVQFRGPDDLRFKLIDLGPFEAGPLAGWRMDRSEDDAERLHGLGNVDGGFIAGAFAALRLGWISPFVSYHHQVSGDDTGGLTRFGLEARGSFAPDASITATFGATYADESYMDAYFSVDSAQAAASSAGLGKHYASAGIKDYYLGLSGDIPLGETWAIKVSGKWARLVGDAADSPIVESTDQFTGAIGLTYKLGGR